MARDSPTPRQASGSRARPAPAAGTSLRISRFTTLLLLLLLPLLAQAAVRRAAAACPVGVNYGERPSDSDESVRASVRRLLQMNPRSFKYFNATDRVMRELQGKDVDVVVGAMPNGMTTEWAASPSKAGAWLDRFIVPWVDSVRITTIAVANEALQGGNGEEAKKVVPGMWALYNALKARGLEGRIKVKTPQHPGLLINPHPPSRAEVLPEVQAPMKDLLSFIKQTGSALYVTPYPFYRLIENPDGTNQDFVFFRGLNGFTDPQTGLYYQNQFDAILDSFIIAVGKLGYPDLPVEVAESGWPSDGHRFASVALAKEYVQRFLGKVCSGQGSPLRPGQFFPFWLFEAFDEAWKATPDKPFEAHFGLNYADGTAKYELDFAATYPVPPLGPTLPPPQHAPVVCRETRRERGHCGRLRVVGMQRGQSGLLQDLGWVPQGAAGHCHLQRVLSAEPAGSRDVRLLRHCRSHHLRPVRLLQVPKLPHPGPTSPGDHTKPPTEAPVEPPSQAPAQPPT